MTFIVVASTNCQLCCASVGSLSHPLCTIVTIASCSMGRRTQRRRSVSGVHHKRNRGLAEHDAAQQRHRGHYVCSSVRLWARHLRVRIVPQRAEFAKKSLATTEIKFSIAGLTRSPVDMMCLSLFYCSFINGHISLHDSWCTMATLRTASFGYGASWQACACLRSHYCHTSIACCCIVLLTGISYSCFDVRSSTYVVFCHRFDEGNKTWRWAGTSTNSFGGGWALAGNVITRPMVTLPTGRGNTRYRIHLPIYNAVTSASVRSSYHPCVFANMRA
jgi:hypothetical protein